MKKSNGLAFALTRSAALTAIICVSAMIYIPLTVPITLQTLALFFGFFALGGRDTTIASLTYVLLGVAGLPVFSGFSGGFARLLDPSGGFILALPLASLLFWIAESVLRPKEKGKIILSAISLLIIYFIGSLWYALVYLGGSDGAFLAALLWSVLPFVIPDIVKLIIAYIISKKVPRL